MDEFVYRHVSYLRRSPADVLALGFDCYQRNREPPYVEVPMEMQSLSQDEFETELDRRINRLQAAANALRATFGPALQGASLPHPNMAENQRLWQEAWCLTGK